MVELFPKLAPALMLLVFSLVALVLLFKFMRRYRDSSDNNHEQTESMLSNFRELHSEGGLSDDEFRKIKTDISSQLKGELKDSDPSDSSD